MEHYLALKTNEIASPEATWKNPKCILGLVIVSVIFVFHCNSDCNISMHQCSGNTDNSNNI